LTRCNLALVESSNRSDNRIFVKCISDLKFDIVLKRVVKPFLAYDIEGVVSLQKVESTRLEAELLGFFRKFIKIDFSVESVINEILKRLHMGSLKLSLTKMVNECRNFLRELCH
jgi:hypothetical protein